MSVFEFMMVLLSIIVGLGISELLVGVARILYCLGLAAAMLGVLFRPIALGYPLFVPDNATSLPTIVLLGVLAWSSRPIVHRVLLPLGLALIVIDTIVISYQIN